MNKEKTIKSMLNTKGGGEIKFPSMQGRRNWQGTENMEERCKILFLKNLLSEQKDTHKF